MVRPKKKCQWRKFLTVINCGVSFLTQQTFWVSILLPGATRLVREVDRDRDTKRTYLLGRWYRNFPPLLTLKCYLKSLKILKQSWKCKHKKCKSFFSLSALWSPFFRVIVSRLVNRLPDFFLMHIPVGLPAKKLDSRYI